MTRPSNVLWIQLYRDRPGDLPDLEDVTHPASDLDGARQAARGLLKQRASDAGRPEAARPNLARILHANGAPAAMFRCEPQGIFEVEVWNADRPEGSPPTE